MADAPCVEQRGRHHVAAAFVGQCAGIGGGERKRQDVRHAAFGAEPDHHRRQRHHICQPPAELERIDPDIADREDDSRRAIEPEQHQRGGDDPAQAPANACGNQQERRKRQERATEIVCSGFGKEHRRFEHRDVDDLRRPRQAEIPPPVGPGNGRNQRRPREIGDEDAIGEPDGTRRFGRFQPDRGQEHERQNRAADRERPGSSSDQHAASRQATPP